MNFFIEKKKNYWHGMSCIPPCRKGLRQQHLKPALELQRQKGDKLREHKIGM